MAEYQKTRDEVEKFLDGLKHLILEPNRISINNKPWKGSRVNKTLAYMAETGITRDDIIKVLGELQTSNYSYTADDGNDNFKNEQVWIFGITKYMIDQDVDLYIKLKIRVIHEEMLLVLSFHPENPGCDDQKLIFPYKE